MLLMLVRELLIEPNCELTDVFIELSDELKLLNCELTDVFNDLIAAVVCVSVFVVPVTFNHAVYTTL
jgi:hypothetical protein